MFTVVARKQIETDEKRSYQFSDEIYSIKNKSDRNKEGKLIKQIYACNLYIEIAVWKSYL